MSYDVGVIVGCGPSLTLDQLDKVSHLKRYGANRSFEFGVDVVLGCNFEFWDHYWPEIKDLPCDKWTTHPTLKDSRPDGLNWIEGRWEDGISTNPDYIAYHHGSGPQILNLAYHYGVRRFILIGWDMCYREKRHYFGEDALTEKHHPRTGPNGELAGLIKEMETINPEIYGIEIINCTPDSAMTCFPMMPLDEALDRYAVAAPRG